MGSGLSGEWAGCYTALHLFAGIKKSVDGNIKYPQRNSQGFNGHDLENGLKNNCSQGVYYGGYEENRIVNGSASGFRFFNNNAVSQATVQFFMGLDDPRT